MECKHGLLVGTCASCKVVRPGHQILKVTGRATCSLCKEQIDVDSRAIWYLRKPAHEWCVLEAGEPDGFQDREDRWAELRRD
jgi:hypothetical protein